ncbi:MAG: isoprenyl transferase [Candidatus Tectomicrobia bacterium]|uniref:Isoprenyl transferase n=1 Tax=Tectimicrobiota bacterium TaxID=2528274 RepID=A0A938AZY8_UNCTE|nr:isoprenyl transferase [Candidatus Tectomicrobia bacterium]
MDPALLSQLQKDKLPKHLAIVMDGNGRWAQRRNLPRNAGHRAGVKSVDDVVSTCRRLGIQALTLFALSTENLERPRTEVHVLMRILRFYLRKEVGRMCQENIHFNTIGDMSVLHPIAQSIIQETLTKTAACDGMIFTLALGYGSHAEIVRTARQLACHVQKGLLAVDDIDEALFAVHLDTAGLPDVDLLIRTSGEKRLSNFLLWQLAYAELYFTPVLWPDFRSDDLLRALLDYQGRERRFGLTHEQLAQAVRS